MNKQTSIATTLFVVALLSVGVAHAETISTNAAIGINAREGNNEGKGEFRADIKANIGTKPRDRAGAEINRRIEALNKLEARIEDMKRVSDASKGSLKATVDAQISILTTLKAKIAADTDDATLKADIASITKNYRIFMIVIPQGAIMANADRISTSADLMATFGTKLNTRIDAADAEGHDVKALESAYSDYKAKITDAKVQAAAALELSAKLVVDNGDKTIMESNKKIMSDARAKLKAGKDDLQAARKDADTIVKGLKAYSVTVEGKAKVKTTTTR